MKIFLPLALVAVFAIAFTVPETKAQSNSLSCSGAAVTASCSGSTAFAKARRFTPVRNLLGRLRARRLASCGG